MRGSESMLAWAVREYNEVNGHSPFNHKQLTCLANYLAKLNPKFNRVGWFLRVKGFGQHSTQGGAK